MMQGSSVINGRQHIGLQKLSALAGVVRSSVGPDIKYKFIQDEVSGESVLACSCFRILESLEPTCAVGQLVFETIQAHHKVYRSGSGCLLFLAGAWSRAALDCLRRGVSVTQVISFMSEGMDICVDVCKKSSVPLEAVRERLAATPRRLGLGQPERTTSELEIHKKTRLSRHFRETASGSAPAAEAPGVADVAEALSHGCDGAAKLVVDAVQLQSRTTPTVDISKVTTCLLPGVPEEGACVLRGCVVFVSHERASVANRIKGRRLKVALINGDLSHTYRHLGFRRTPGVQRVSERLVSPGPSEEDGWSEKVVGVFSSLGVSLVVTTGLACEKLVQLCCDRHVLVVEKIHASVLRTMAAAFGAVPVTYATQLSEHSIGRGVRVSIWRDLGGSAATVSVSTGGDDGLVTAVITSCVRAKLPALEDQFWACAHRLHHALKDNVLLPGAGATETLCVHHLLKQAERRHGGETAVYRGDVLRLMADGLVDYITAILVNGGRFSAVEARTAVSRQLQDSHSDQIIAGKFSQLALKGGEEENPEVFPAVKRIIYDNLSVKLQAWRRALDLVFLVLQTDAEIITGTHRGEDGLTLL